MSSLKLTGLMNETITRISRAPGDFGASHRIVAVIVAYEPSEVLLLKLLLALKNQIHSGVIVNNGVILPLSDADIDQMGFHVIHLQSNMGVATALNTGFRWAQCRNAELVITFDQDSEPAPEMILKLFNEYEVQVELGIKVGAIGPQQVDRRSGRLSGFIAPISWRRCRVVPALGKVVKVDHLITSGCLVPIAVWQDVGPFLDSLFIDYVDIEWSLRLRSKDWQLFGVGGAYLSHAMGDDLRSVCGIQIPWHSPLRHYFMFRNGIHLQKLSHISIGWKFVDVLYLFKRLLLYTLVAGSRIEHLKAILRGVRDGWRGQLGPSYRKI